MCNGVNINLRTHIDESSKLKKTLKTLDSKDERMSFKLYSWALICLVLDRKALGGESECCMSAH